MVFGRDRRGLRSMPVRRARTGTRARGRTGTVALARARPSISIASNVGVRAGGGGLRTGGFLGIEKKFKDFDVFDKAFANTWVGGEMNPDTALCVSAVGQGDGESERDGRNYTIHSLHIKGLITTSTLEAQANPTGDQSARIIVVIDSQTNAAELSAEDVMLVIGTAKDTNSFRNLQNTQRFKILKDAEFRIPFADIQMAQGAVNLFASSKWRGKEFNWNFNFPGGIKVNTKATGATIASITDNSIHVIGVCSSTVPLLIYHSRIRFTG